MLLGEEYDRDKARNQKGTEEKAYRGGETTSYRSFDHNAFLSQIIPTLILRHRSVKKTEDDSLLHESNGEHFIIFSFTQKSCRGVKTGKFRLEYGQKPRISEWTADRT